MANFDDEIDDEITNKAVLAALEVHRGPSKEMRDLRDQIEAANPRRKPCLVSIDKERMDREFLDLITASHEGRSVAALLKEFHSRIGDIPEVVQINEERMVFFRVRKNIDPDQEDITKPATFGYPPALFAPHGRANLAGLPVLYCAFSTKTAFAEASINPSDRVYLAIYVKSWRTPMSLSICLFDDVSRDHPFSIWARRGENAYSDHLGPTSDQREALLHARKLLSRLFLRENYGVSSRLAFYNLYHAGFNAIVYPSVANPHDCNVAIHPGFSDRTLKLWRVYEVSVEAGFERHHFLRRAMVVNDIAKWEDCTGGDDEELRRFVKSS